MAERRMFAKTIVLSDAFLDMPLGARCLYMTLGMVADDDGFVNNPRSIMRQAGATDDDMKILLAKKFVLLFDDGVIVIKHWRINNYLQKDRYKPTVYKEDFDKLSVDDKNIYHVTEEPCIHNMCIHSTVQDSTGKDSIEEVSTGTVHEETSYEKPTLEEVRAYCAEIGSRTDPERFWRRYQQSGWKGVRSWKGMLRAWSEADANRPAPSPAPQPQRRGNYFVQHSSSLDYSTYMAESTPVEDVTDEEIEDFNNMLRGGKEE